MSWRTIYFEKKNTQYRLETTSGKRRTNTLLTHI